uniref:Uncharacterized protein n=1 Tax=Lates calcarifer TaxID=8187 RepID=A0A4W6CPG4_LATCA
MIQSLVLQILKLKRFLVSSGESFDRQASFRRTASNIDSLSRRPRNLSRRKTVTGIPYDVTQKLGISSTHSFPHPSINQSMYQSV